MAQTIDVNRKERLERLFDLAQAYRGWTRKVLARELGRDPTKLAPESGNPKFELVLQIAEILDWTLEEVADWLCYTKENVPAKISESTFDQLDRKAQDLHRDGEYRELVDVANLALDVASNSDETARSYNRATGGWDGLGRFSRVLKAAQAGLR